MRSFSPGSQLTTIGQQLIERTNAALKDASVSHLVRAVPYRWNAMPHLHAATNAPSAQECRRALVVEVRSRGALLLENHNSFVNAAHTPEDVERTAEALHDAAAHLAPCA